MLALEPRPGYACYYPGETASLGVRTLRGVPGSVRLNIRVVHRDSRRVVKESEGTVACAPEGTFTCGPIDIKEPGLYLAEITADHQLTAETGFWVYDEKFMASALPLTVNRDYFLKEGRPYPILGATYMSSVTHRAWMVDPTPAAWDRDFAAMQAAGINLVRTGLWAGWKTIMPAPGAFDEAALRALTAFLLSARAYDIPVIFTVFAFVPPLWAGENPYLDPAAIRAQADFIEAIACRLAPANHLLWDFINEPSFSTRQQLWSCRPNRDKCEATAWRHWLTDQNISDDEWRERWRLTPAQPLDVPAEADFNDQHGVADRRPLRSLDFVRFAQESFAAWAARMKAAVRTNHNPHQLVTVGQDEAGGSRSPSPHFHAAQVDFTSNHPWWENDDLLWDALVSKTAARPNLLEEVGNMFPETPEVFPGRTPAQSRDLLERKLALSFAGGCAGFIIWIWNTWTYNRSDNEVGIGLVRADGSEKPEMAPVRAMAGFFSKNARHMTGRRPERAVVILPHSNIFSARNTARFAVQRSVRVLAYRLGVSCRTASEYCMDTIGDASLIILPAPHILRSDCWAALLEKVAQGATLLVTGYIETDEYMRPCPRLAAFGVQTHSCPVMHAEHLPITVPGHAEAITLTLSLKENGSQKFLKAVGADNSVLPFQEIAHGQGKILYCPLPVEHAHAEEATEAVYRLAALRAAMVCAKNVSESSASPGLLVRPVEFEKAVLFLVVNESNTEHQAIMQGTVLTSPQQWRHSVTVPAGRAAVAFIEKNTGRVLDTYLPDNQLPY
jgi:hypothetical protein